jgi:hypothetical protein
LSPTNTYGFAAPLWIDLGGIAKGYAVDRAMEKLRARGAVQACVNAGGDLSVHGPDSESVLLRTGQAPGDVVPVLEIENAAVASSGFSTYRSLDPGPHIDGRSRRPTPAGRFVSVVADHCVVADALTKWFSPSKSRASRCCAIIGLRPISLILWANGGISGTLRVENRPSAHDIGSEKPEDLRLLTTATPPRLPGLSL